MMATSSLNTESADTLVRVLEEAGFEWIQPAAFAEESDVLDSQPISLPFPTVRLVSLTASKYLQLWKPVETTYERDLVVFFNFAIAPEASSREQIFPLAFQSARTQFVLSLDNSTLRGFQSAPSDYAFYVSTRRQHEILEDRLKALRALIGEELFSALTPGQRDLMAATAGAIKLREKVKLDRVLRSLELDNGS